MSQSFLVEYQQQGTNEERERHRAAHIAYRIELGDALWLAGPLLNDDGAPVGSVIILEAANREAAQDLAARDPMVSAGVLSICSVRALRIAHAKIPTPRKA